MIKKEAKHETTFQTLFQSSFDQTTYTETKKQRADAGTIPEFQFHECWIVTEFGRTSKREMSAYTVRTVCNQMNYFLLKFTVTQCALTDHLTIENETLGNKTKELRTKLSRQPAVLPLISSAETEWNILWSFRNGKPQTSVHQLCNVCMSLCNNYGIPELIYVKYYIEEFY